MTEKIQSQNLQYREGENLGGRGGGYEGIPGLQAGGVFDLPAGGVRDLLSVVLAPPPVVAVGPPRPPPRTPPRPTPPLTTPCPRVGDLPRIVGGATLQLPLVGGGGPPAHFGPSRHGLLVLKNNRKALKQIDSQRYHLNIF